MYRHWPSAKSVSNAREDLPEPDTPVTTVRRSWGISSEMFLRLFCRAPWMRSPRGRAIRTVLLRWVVYWKSAEGARVPAPRAPSRGAEGFLAERADEAGMRFDGNTGPHDHFTCLACGRIYDVPARAEAGVRRRLAARTGFEVLDHRTEYYGRCGACRRQGGRSPVTRQRRS